MTPVLLLGACGGDDGGANPDASGPPADAKVADAALADADLAPDADLTPDAGAGAGEINCDTLTCSLTTSDGCCYDAQGTTSCLAKGGSCPVLLYKCDGKEDCQTGVCCLENNTVASCLDAATCLAKPQENSVVCHTNVDCPAQAQNCCSGTCSADPC